MCLVLQVWCHAAYATQSTAQMEGSAIRANYPSQLSEPTMQSSFAIRVRESAEQLRWQPEVVVIVRWLVLARCANGLAAPPRIGRERGV